VFEDDRQFFLSQVGQIVDVMSAKTQDPFLRNLAVETLFVLAKANRFLQAELTEVLEAF